VHAILAARLVLNVHWYAQRTTMNNEDTNGLGRQVINSDQLYNVSTPSLVFAVREEEV